MTKLKRDYKAEYARRIARGQARGLSKSQARGHPKANEKPLAQKRRKPIAEDNLQIALQSLAKGESLTASAKEAQITRERLRNQLKELKLISKKSQRWTLRNGVPRRWEIFSEGKIVPISVTGKRKNTFIGSYHAAVGKFLRSSDIELLKPYEGKIIVDDSGVPHILETDPNILYQLRIASSDGFEAIYNIATMN